MSLARSLRVFMKRVSHRHGATAMSTIQSGSIINQLMLKPIRLLMMILSVSLRPRHLGQG